MFNVFLKVTGKEVQADLSAQLTWFSRYLLIHLAARDWVLLTAKFQTFRLILAVGFSILFLSLFHRKSARYAMWGALALISAKLYWNFPGFSNHFAMEYLCVFMLAFVGTAGQQERELVSIGLRWLVVWLFFFSGLQKVLHGTYFGGEFLALGMAYGDRYTSILAPFLSAQESLNTRLLGAAPAPPYRFESVPALILSNSVWVGEILAALLLVSQRLRGVGIFLTLLAIVSIEIVARELMFGLLVVNLLALFASTRWSRWGFFVAIPFYSYLLLGRLGAVPIGYFN